jgi:hypothetical protein
LTVTVGERSFQQLTRIKPGFVSECHPNNQTTTMGDKSPKANQKKSSQKQAKASSASQAKKQPAAGTPAAGKKP